MNCPNCFKELQDGTLFCDACGTQIQSPVPAEEMSVEAMTFCTNCGAQTKADVPFCQNCGAAIETKKKKGGKFPKKLIGIGIAVVAVVLVAAIVLPLVLGGLGSSDLGCMAYVKDGQLYYVKDAKAEAVQITSKLFDDKKFDDEDIASDARYMWQYVTITPDGKRLFYVDKLDPDADGATLFYKNPNKADSEATKIDSDIKTFSVNVKGTKIIYLKGDKLYEYDMKEKNKIANDVEDFFANADCSVVFYSTDESLYRWESGKGEEEITDDEDVSVLYITDDFKTLYYRVSNYDSDGYYDNCDVYKWTVGGKGEKLAKNVIDYMVTENEDLYLINEDGDFCRVKSGESKAEEIDSDVTGLVKILESGEVYYKKSTDSAVMIGQFIEDDMKEEDDAIIEMEKPEYPDYDDWDWPTYEGYPKRSDYDDYDEYYEAYYAWLDEYYAAYDEAEAAYDAAVDEYYELLEVWEENEEKISAKQARDSIRADMETYEMSVTNSTYCLYDGKNTKEIVSDVGSLVSNSAESNVLCVGINNYDAVEKVKLSDIYNDYGYSSFALSYAENSIERAISEAQSIKLIFGEKLVDFDHEDATGIYISDDGKYLYYKEDVSEDDGSYTLIKMNIADGKLGKAEKVADDVGKHYIINGDVHYFVDVEYEDDGYYTGAGDYYINGKEIADDVYINNFSYDEEKNITYFYTDYDSEKKRGTLNICENGKAVEICEDVDGYRSSDNGDIYMLCDVSEKDYQGDIYVFNGKEAVKLDKDVYSLVYIMTTEERYEYFHMLYEYYNQ